MRLFGYKGSKDIGKYLPLIITLLIISALILTGFSAKSDVSSSIITLKYADQNSATGWEASHTAQPWLDQIRTVTNGRVQVVPYYSESLTKGANAWEAVKLDLTDMAWLFHGYWADRTPLANVVSLPLLPFISARQAGGILWQLYQKYPSIQSEFQDTHVLLVWASTPYFLVTSEKQVRTLEDFRNLKIRVTSGPPVEMMQALGSIPVTIGMPDTYLYLKKGVIDGAAVTWENIISWRLYDVVKYYTYVPLFTVYFSQVININTWDSLPQDIKSQITSVSGLRGSLFWGENMFDTSASTGRELIKQKGFPFIEYTLPQSEQNTLTQVAGQPIWDAWVKNMTEAGHPEAQEILNTTLDLIKNYQP